MTDEEKQKRRKFAKWGALAGALLALACHLMPPDYRAVCDAFVTVCTGGIK